MKSKTLLLFALMLLLGALLLFTSGSVTAALDEPSALVKAQLRSPGINAVVYGGRPTYRWYPQAEATVYDVEMYNSAIVLMNTWNKGVAACDPGPYCDFRIPFDLQSNYGDYYWRVRARNSSETGAWSDLRKFTYTQLDRTAIISPVDGYVSEITGVQFRWTDITGATMYLVQIRQLDDTLVSNILVDDEMYCNGTSCTWRYDRFIPDGDYKWHVRAKNGRNFGRWTAYRAVTIDQPRVIHYFDDDAPNWIDPHNKWDIMTPGIYYGLPGTCSEYNCATTYYDRDYTEAAFTPRIRSTGGNYDRGFALFARAQFASDGTWTSGIRIRFSQNGDNISAVVDRLYNGTLSMIGSSTITSSSIGDYYYITVDVLGSWVYVYFNDVFKFQVPINSPETNIAYGKFGVDVSTAYTSHIIHIDEAEIVRPSSP
jgi:hypothetical protein